MNCAHVHQHSTGADEDFSCPRPAIGSCEECMDEACSQHGYICETCGKFFCLMHEVEHTCFVDARAA